MALTDPDGDSGVHPPVPETTRRAFWWLERFAPAIGARWATELWCTVPDVDLSTKMPPGLPDSTPVEASWDGHRLAGQSWGSGPLVYLVHGWGGCRAHMAVFVKPLVAAGYRVIAFDLPSHNDSEPGALALGRSTIVECAEAVRAVIAEHGPAHAVIGHSLGAKAAALAVSRGAAAEKLVFLAPMGEFSWYLDVFAERHNFGRRIRDRLHRRLDKRIGMPLLETDIAKLAARVGDRPLLVIHDPDDPDALYSESEEIVQVWPDARLETTKGLGRLAHYRILRHRPAITAGVEFIGTP
jgi:pimeloyl-ACP methyl ester carboxylesterase